MKSFKIDVWINELREKGGGLFLLLDPDKGSPGELAERAFAGVGCGVEAILVGGSLLLGDGFEQTVIEIKKRVDKPVLIFPGNSFQLAPQAAGLLFLSLISGRNPRWLIEEHVHAAPRIIAMGLPCLPTAYLLIESGNATSVAFVSGTMPIPRNKPDIVTAHTMAAELLGMRAIYLEAGSGAKYPVPAEIVAEVSRKTSLPIIVGGGIRDVETARTLVDSGADFLVIGSAFEDSGDTALLREIAKLR